MQTQFHLIHLIKLEPLDCDRRLVLNGIAAHGENIAALGIVRQSQIWRLEPSGIYIIKINASANLTSKQKKYPPT